MGEMCRRVQELIRRSEEAEKIYASVTQEQADRAARIICRTVYEHAGELAAIAVEDSGMGNVPDKTTKCRMKSSLIWNSIRNQKTTGVIFEDRKRKIAGIAKPMGVVAGIIPSTNPIVTPMCNAAFALKTRNVILFASHPGVVTCTKHLISLFRKELGKAGFPEDLVQILDESSREGTAELMRCSDLVIATGGRGMVRSAYESGTPSLGVGQGNVQCIVDTDADLLSAADMILTGRSFDNGLICLGEQTVFVQKEQMEAFIKAVGETGGYFVEKEEDTERIRNLLFPGNGPLNREIAGKDAGVIAEKAGLQVPEDTRVILVRAKASGKGDSLCREKLCPVLTVYPYDTFRDGVSMMMENLEAEGKGHSISIHSDTPEHVAYAAEQCPVARVIVNQPAGTTGGGSLTNGFTPTTTLGCGTWGNNSFSGNLNCTHLMNITRVGYPYEKPFLSDLEDAWNEE